MNRGRNPLPLLWILVVTHEIVNVVQQRLRLSEVGVAQQIDVEVRNGHRVNTGSYGVGCVITGPRRPVQLPRKMDRQIAIGCVERRALGVLRVETGEVEKQSLVNIRRAEDDLTDLYLPMW